MATNKKQNTRLYYRNLSRVLVLICIMATVYASSQGREEITGTIISLEDSEPLAGASIYVKGDESRGVVADFDGNFIIEASINETLVFSYIGFETKEVNIEGRTVLNIALQPNLTTLDEVVLLGYGSVKKSDLTGSVSSLGQDDFNKGVQSSVEQLLQSRVPGVKITQSNSAPGGGISVRIRGASSISGGNQPLYVIDGQPMDNDGTAIPSSAVMNETSPRNPLKALNPNDIESIQVLKDASATAIYGSRGANGVILITTKKGTSGKLQVNYSLNTGLQTAIQNIEYLDATEYTTFINDIRADRGQEPVFSADEVFGAGKGTNWMDAILRTAVTQDHQLSFSGGSENTNYFSSFNNFQQDGVVIGTGTQRLSGRINLEHSQDNFDFGVNLTTSQLKDNFVPNGNNVSSDAGIIVSAAQFDPTVPVLSDEGSYTITNDIDMDNPVAIGRTIFDEAITNRTFGNVFANYGITDDLSAKLLFGYDSQISRRDAYINTETKRGLATNGSASILSQERKNHLIEATFSYERTFNENHSINAVAGYTFQEFNGRGQTSSVVNFVTDIFRTDNLGAGDPERAIVASNRFQSTLLSYLGRINYSFMNKYLFTASFRADGSSKFGEGNKYGIFPSGALAWKIGEEKFIKDSGIFSNLKVRTSYGLTGNQEIGIGQSLILLGPDSPAIFDGAQFTSIAPLQLSNPELKWETTSQFDIGIDFGIFNNRVTGSIDYYIKKTSDLLLALPVPSTTGFSTSLQNVGDTQNRGLDFMFETKNIRGDDFYWSTSFNISTLSNEVVSLGSLDEILQGDVVFVNNFTILTEGQPMNSYYGYKTDGIFRSTEEVASSAQPTAEPGDIRFRDSDGDGDIDSNDRTILGNPIPDYNIGINNEIYYKGLEFSFFFDGSFGHQLANFSRIDSEIPIEELRNRQTYVLDRWTPSNPDSPNPSFVGATSRERATNDRIVEDASFIRLRNVVLSYNFPNLKNSFLRSLSVNFTAQNIWTITDYSGNNPDVNTLGNSNIVVDYGAYPLSKIFSLGINIGL